GNIGAYLPFYRIHCEVSGIELESYADLVRIANLPKVIQPDWEKRAFCFWAPAFKVNPFNFLSFSRKLTLTQPRRDWEEELPREALHPVTLPIQEAVESLKITLASFMKPQEVLCPRLGEIHIRPKSFLLVYIPFQEEKHELYQPALRLTINRTLLGYANRL
ncbi:MAG: hypothetical protein JW821_06055, partial [Deltaproteobacteria bacterium]|nr:hypothetical protein [Deltaproteobacteria bacterium]